MKTNVIEKTKAGVNKVIYNPTTQSLMGSAAIVSLMMTDMASASAASAISTALGYVSKIFMYLGIFFAVISFAQLMLALKREDAEGQSTQIRNLLIGFVLAGAGKLMGVILTALGVTDVSVDTGVSL